jgi:NAD+ kinase
VLVIVNRRKPDAEHALRHVVDLIERHGTLVGVLDAESPDGRVPSPGGVDLIAVLGGDGTLLGAARRHGAMGRPLVGINIGRVGFLAAYELDRVEGAAADLFGTAPLHERSLPELSVAVHNAGVPQPRATETALNEFVVTAGPPYRMITLRLLIDGHDGPLVSGDGLIVSTPTGSTAYSLSAGGPIVAPGVDAVVLTPIAAHTLSFRPIVVPMASTVEVSVESVNATEEAGTTLVADGQVHHRLREGDRLVFRAGPSRARFVVDPLQSYWDTLQGKMRWAIPPKRRGS